MKMISWYPCPQSCEREGRMQRREIVRLFCGGALLALLVVPSSAWSQSTDKPRRVGVLSLGSSSDPAIRHALIDGLREHGWEEGRNVVLEERHAGLDPARLLELAAELDALRVDVIMTGNAETLD